MPLKKSLSNYCLLGLAPLLLLPYGTAAQSTGSAARGGASSIVPGTPGPVAIQMNQYGLTSLTVGGVQWLGYHYQDLVGDFFASTWRGGNTNSNYEKRISGTLNGNTTVQT